MSANSSIFGILARTPPIILKLYQYIKGIILNKNHKKIENSCSHIIKIAIRNPSLPKFKRCRRDIQIYFLGILIVKTEYDLEIDKNSAI